MLAGGVGAVLMQERPTAFYSHALQGKNLLLSTYEKEILALVLAVQKWRPYLLGGQFIVRTDQQSLKYLWDQKITTIAQQRWLYKLRGFDFVIVYKKGKENVVADALSRRDVVEANAKKGELSAFSQPVPNWIEAVKQEVELSSNLQALVQRIISGEAMGPWRIIDGVILFKDRIYLETNSSLIEDIIGQFHNTTHEGYHKMSQRIRVNFYWPKMWQHIRKFISACDICQRHKTEQLAPAGLLQPLPIPNQVWEDISMDFIDGLPLSKGKTTILVVIDRLSKYAHFLSLSHPYTAVSVAQIFFDNIFKLHGMPRTIVCDRDPTFTSIFWSELFKINGTSFNYSSAYHPQTDGHSEVVNGTLEMYLRCLTSSRPREWVKWFAWAEYCYNTSWHSSIKTTPFEVVYGRPPPTLPSYIPGMTNVDAVEKQLMERDHVLKELKVSLQEVQSRMKKVYDQHHREREFEVGDWVYLKLQPFRQASISLRRNAKLSPKYYGPFKILQKIGAVSYKLELPKESRIHPVFHVSLLKKKIGEKYSVQGELPIVEENTEHLIPKPQAIWIIVCIKEGNKF